MKVCEGCGKVPPSYKPMRKYCSAACYKAHRKPALGFVRQFLEVNKGKLVPVDRPISEPQRYILARMEWREKLRGIGE